MIRSVSTPIQPSPLVELDHVDSQLDHSTSSPVSSSSSSTSPGECLKSSNQEAKKKKKKLDKHGANLVVISPNALPIYKPFNPLYKVKLFCRLCKGHHLLRDCPGIPRVLEVWSQNLDPPSPSTSGDHVDATPSPSDGKRKGKIKFPCRLFEGDHLLHICPFMDETSTVLQPQLPIGYQRLSSNPLLVGKEIDLDSSLSHPALPMRGSLMFNPKQPLVETSVDLAPPSVVHSVSDASSDHTTHVLLISLDSHELKTGPPILVV